jgi:hypothetical protein
MDDRRTNLTGPDLVQGVLVDDEPRESLHRLSHFTILAAHSWSERRS